MRMELEDNPLLRMRGFANSLPKTEHSPKTKKIVEDGPPFGSKEAEWAAKQTRLLLTSIRQCKNPDDADVIFSKIFDIYDQQLIGLRFYFLRWLLSAVRDDVQYPPFRGTPESFSFAKVWMLLHYKKLSPELKELLLSLEIEEK